MTAAADLSIIIVNWNSTEYARECIASIYAYTSGIRFEIIVVDNASPANDVHRLKDCFPDIAVIRSRQNLGFARANNLGVSRATGQFLLFLNPDTRLVQPALQAMVDALRSRPDAGAVGCKLLNEDLTVQTSCIQNFPTILNQALDAGALRSRWPNSPLWGIAPLSRATPAPVPVEVVSGACLLIGRNVFVEVGMFSEDYFMYAEDLDLCRKTVRAGYRNYYTGSARVIHFGGGSSAPETATIMKWRSILHYCEKHHGAAYAFLFRAAMTVMAVFRLSILSAGAALRISMYRPGSGYSAAAKWKTILSTLLRGVGARQQC